MSIFFNQLRKLLNIKIEHFISDAFLVILFQFKLHSEKLNFILGKVNEFVKLVFHLISFEIVAQNDSVVKGVDNELFEILFKSSLSGADQG